MPREHVDRQRRNESGTIESVPFYLAGLSGLSPTERWILLLLADTERRGRTFWPSLPKLAKMCGCSRSKAWRELRALEQGNERHKGGWIVCEWRGGKHTNIYTPGRRLARIIQRSSPAWIFAGMKRRLKQ
jgi:hypothetical protein